MSAPRPVLFATVWRSFFAQQIDHIGKLRRIPAVGANQVVMGRQHQFTSLSGRHRLRPRP